MMAQFHLMTIASDGQVKFEKVLPAENSNDSPPLRVDITVLPSQMMGLELAAPYPKKYTVYNCHIKIDNLGRESAIIELLDPDETASYPKLA